MVLGWYGGCLVMCVVSWFWRMGLIFVILGCDSRKVPSQKSLFFDSMDPSLEIIILFSSWYQCWLNCYNIFWGNLWSMNDVQHFAKMSFRHDTYCMLQDFYRQNKYLWLKCRPQLHKLTYFMHSGTVCTKNYSIACTIFMYQ